MGSGASKNKSEDGNTKFKDAAIFVGKLEVVRKNAEDRQASANDRIPCTLSYNDTSAAWEQLRLGQDDSGVSLKKTSLNNLKTRRGVSDDIEDDSEDDIFDVPYAANEQKLMDDFCCICGHFKKSEAVHPCRCCTRIYHTQCLVRSGQSRNDPPTIDRLISSLGWSCPVCDNLESLLTDTEMRELITCFDKYDLNRDSSISKEEFIRYKQKVHFGKFGVSMDREDTDMEEVTFGTIDVDKTGALDWWEFKNHESLRVLHKRSKASLIKLLTSKEVEAARQTFKFFDTDGDRQITEYEAKRAYSRWFGKFLPTSLAEDIGGLPTQLSSPLGVHMIEQTKLMMEADVNSNGCVSWEEYLKSQALYIISARPNRPLKTS